MYISLHNLPLASPLYEAVYHSPRVSELSAPSPQPGIVTGTPWSMTTLFRPLKTRITPRPYFSVVSFVLYNFGELPAIAVG